MPVKKDLAKQKKLKPKKMRAVRGERARQPAKKPNVKQIVNIYTTKAEPYTTDFKNQFRYGLGFTEREQTPFQPIFNYIQPPVQNVAKVEEKKIEITEPKAKRTYKKTPVAVAVAESGYESTFMPSEIEAFRQPTREEESEVLARAKIKKMEEELRRQPSDPEFFSGNLSPVITKPRGRPKGSSKKSEEQFKKPIAQADITQFFGKVGGGGAKPVIMESE